MKLYLIGGKARHGKDVVGQFIRDYYEMSGCRTCRLHLSSPIRHYAKDQFGWDGRDESKPRTLMQTMATDVIRKKLKKEDFFIRRMVEDIEILDQYFDIGVVTDVRFPIEFEQLKKMYPSSVSILVERPGFETTLTAPQKRHITETALDDYQDFDYKLINTTLDELKEDAIAIVRKEEEV